MLKAGFYLVRVYNHHHPYYTVDVEDDGRYIVDFPDVPGAMAYGRTTEEAFTNASKLLPWPMQPGN